MNKPSLTVIKNLAEQSAKIYLYGIIGDYWNDGEPLTAKRFMQELLALEGKYNRVDIHINSPGGDVWEGLGICNAIRASKIDIHTWNDGLAASMGAVILASAKDENRHTAKGSITMIHNASTICWGNSQDMQSTAEFLDKHDDVLAGFFADATGLSIEQIKADYFDFKDHWLTAQEVESLGLATIEDYESEKVADNITNMPLMKVAALYQNKENEPSASFLTKVVSKVQEILNPQNQNTDMKFPKLEALVKRPAAEVTEELVNAVNTEIAEMQIAGASFVLDSDLLNAAELQETINQRDADLVTANASIASITTERDALQARLVNAVVAPTAPVKVNEGVEGSSASADDSFETSYDREAKARFSN